MEHGNRSCAAVRLSLCSIRVSSVAKNGVQVEPTSALPKFTRSVPACHPRHPAHELVVTPTNQPTRLSQEGKPYLANASHPSLGDAEVAGKFFATQFALKFEGETGAVELPYGGLDLAFGTKKDPRVTFTNETDPDCILTASNEDITGEVAFRGNGHLRRQVDTHREHVESVRRLVLTALFCAGFVALSAVLGATIEWLLPRLIHHVPVKWEQELGQKLAWFSH